MKCQDCFENNLDTAACGCVDESEVSAEFAEGYAQALVNLSAALQATVQQLRGVDPRGLDARIEIVIDRWSDLLRCGGVIEGLVEEHGNEALRQRWRDSSRW